MKFSNGQMFLVVALLVISPVEAHAEFSGHDVASSTHQHLRPNFLHSKDQSGSQSLLETGGSSWESWVSSEVKRDEAAVEESMQTLLTRLDGVPPGRQQMYFRPVSTTLQCVMLLTIVSLIIYTSLAVSRNVDELGGEFKPSTVTQTLTAASRGGAFPPMMCMLFVGCRMFVLATTQGLGEPPLWVKRCMYAATGAVICQILIVLALPFCAKGAKQDASYDMTEGKLDAAKKEGAKDNAEVKVEQIEEPATEEDAGLHELTGELNDAHPNLRQIVFLEEEVGGSWMYPVFWTVQVATVIFLYFGVAGVIIGIFTFPAQTTKISAAVLCTIKMSILYFWSFFMLWLGRTWYECNFQRLLLNAALSMSSVTRKVPQFAVLFLVSRMRALQLDPPTGMPPAWMQACFFTITASIFVEAFAAAFVGTFGEFKKGYYGVYIYHCKYTAVHVVQHVCAIMTYACLVPIAVGVYMMKDQAGSYAPLSTTMNCTLVFTAIYFTVALLQTCVFFVEDVVGTEMNMLQDTFIAAGIGVSFAPLLCILFVATRMRALQITQQKGDPPGWAQDCMLICVFATCVQAVCCLLMPIFIGQATKVDDDGNPNYDLRPMIGAYAITVVKFVAMLSLHGGVLTICTANFLMTPETAHSGDRFIQGGKQFFEGIAVTLGVLCIALLLSSAKVVGMAVKLAIESCDEVFLGVNIEIQNAALSVCKGYVNIKHLTICQPQKETIVEKDADGKVVLETERELTWEKDYVLKAKTILVKIDMWTLVTSLGKTFELENLNISGIDVNIEKPTMNTKSHDSNVEYIVKHIDSMGLMPPEDLPELDEDTQVILHKLVLGDIGCGVRVGGVPVIGHLSFHPKVGILAFDDIQHTIFEDKKDLAAPEVIKYVTKAIFKKLSSKVMHEIPAQIARKTGDSAKAMAKNMVTCGSSCTGAIPRRQKSSKEDVPIKAASASTL